LCVKVACPLYSFYYERTIYFSWLSMAYHKSRTPWEIYASFGEC